MKSLFFSEIDEPWRQIVWILSNTCLCGWWVFQFSKEHLAHIKKLWHILEHLSIYQAFTYPIADTYEAFTYSCLSVHGCVRFYFAFWCKYAMPSCVKALFAASQWLWMKWKSVSTFYSVFCLSCFLHMFRAYSVLDFKCPLHFVWLLRQIWLLEHLSRLCLVTEANMVAWTCI